MFKRESPGADLFALLILVVFATLFILTIGGFWEWLDSDTPLSNACAFVLYFGTGVLGVWMFIRGRRR